MWRTSSLKIVLHFLYNLWFSMFKTIFFKRSPNVFSRNIVEVSFKFKLAASKGFTLRKTPRLSSSFSLIYLFSISDANSLRKILAIFSFRSSGKKIIFPFERSFRKSFIFVLLLSMKPGSLLVYSLISHFCSFLNYMYLGKEILWVQLICTSISLLKNNRRFSDRRAKLKKTSRWLSY